VMFIRISISFNRFANYHKAVKKKTRLAFVKLKILIFNLWTPFVFNF